MSKTEIVRVRIEPDLKHRAEEILKNLGLSNSQAIGLFYKQIVFTQSLPFDLKIPNEETQDVMLDVLLKRNMNKPVSLQEFKDKYL